MQHLKLFKLLCVDFFRHRSLNMWSPLTWRKTWTKHSAKSFLMFNWPSAKSEGTGFHLHNLKIFVSCNNLTVSHIISLYSDILSLKREIRKLAQEDCGYEEPTIAMAHVYFEKLALHGKLDKQNRKLCAGACILLAAKISNDLKKPEVKHLIDVSKALWY